jgi:hypothetical protein
VNRKRSCFRRRPLAIGCGAHDTHCLVDSASTVVRGIALSAWLTLDEEATQARTSGATRLPSVYTFAGATGAC